MFEALGSHTYRFRFLIVAAWIAVAVLSYKLAPSIASQGTADQSAFLPASAPSVVANDAIEQAFPGSVSTSSATITFSRDTGLTTSDTAYLESFATWITGAEAPTDLRDAVTSVDTATSRPELASMLESSDGQLQLVNVNLNVSSAGDQAAAVVAALRDHAAATAPQGLAVHVTGAAGITTDYIEAIQAGTDSTTVVTILLVIVILLLIYRAPLAALVPLATIGGAFVVARGILGVLAAAGWQISSLLDTFVVVIVFGVGTDYTIFLISRYREEVRGGEWHDASRRTVRRIGAVISASAATVIVGLGAMAFGQFQMIQTMGPALAVAVAVTLLAGLTLAPALLGIFGHYLFWPLHERTGNEEGAGGFFARLAGVVTRYPGIVTAVVVVALLIPAAFVPQMKTNFDTLAELPANSDARAGYDEVAAHLGKGKIVQSTGLIDAGPQGDILAPASLARLRDTMAELSATAGVGSATSLVTPGGDGKVPDGFKPSVQLTTIADSFASSGGSSGSTSGASSLLDPKVSSGLSGALDYVNAVGLAFPDIAARSQFRDATSALEEAQSIVAQATAQSVVSTQLRTLASALTSPTAVAASSSSASSGNALIASYLEELAAAYPEVRGLPAFDQATAAAATLARQPTAAAAVDAAGALNELAVHFDSRPDATLAAASLASTPSALEAKRRATTAFEAIPATMRSLGSLFAGRSDDIFIPVGLGGSNAASLQQAVDAFVSSDRTATRFYVTSTGDPYSTPAFDMIRRVQGELAAAAPSFGTGAVAVIDGPTAQLADVQTVLGNDFQRVGVITVLGILVVLIILLRAIVAPLYLVATVLLSYGSAVGLSAWLFQDVLGHPGVSFYLPLIVFVLLVALGSDYNIFLMSRVREESETRPIHEGIRVASGRTGAVITSAGLILAGTFGSMATAQLAVLFQVGVAVAIGILIDTFVVRSILVPAITTLVGDRAWWPSGSSLATRWLAPVGAAPVSAILASTDTAAGIEVRPRRSPARVAVAILLAMLVPLTFAGLIVWARPDTGSLAVHAAIVNGDEGATTTAADGATKTVRLGAELASSLQQGSASDPVTWTITDATTAASGLSDGTYGAVLTIPAGYSHAVVSVQNDPTGGQPNPTLHLQTSDSTGAATQEVARDLSAAVSTAATQGATEAYVGDLLLGVSTTQGQLSGSATTASQIATRTSTLASDATGVGTVAGELVSGLDQLASGTAGAIAGAAKLASGTSALASGAKQLASGATQLAGGASSAASGAAQLSSGASQLAGGLRTLDGQTSGLPAQATALDQGAQSLAAGASQTATGAAELSAGLDILKTRTTGLGAQVASLDQGAAAVDAGATALAGGSEDLASKAGQLSTAVAVYTQSVAALNAGCGTAGASAAFCGALAGIVAQNTDLTALADGVATGASQLATGVPDVSPGAAGLAAGATSVHQGTSELAAAAPGLEAGIAQSAQGAASLATGTAGVASGAASLADGTHRLAAGMPSLAGGVSSLSSAASQVAGGASSLASGVSGLASGASGIASGAQQTATGAAALAAGTAASASGTSQLSSAVGQAADGARVVQAETGQLAQDGGSLAKDAASAATTLDSAASSTRAVPGGAQDTVAGEVATPVAVEAATTGGGSPTGFAPYVIALALWLGALAALVVLPAGRRRNGRWGWTAPLGAFAAAALLVVLAAGLMTGGLLLVGLSIASLLEFLAVSAVAVLAFVAFVQALVVAFGRRGWLVGLLLAGVQVAASGLVYPVDALPGPLAFVHPLLPMTWASDALATAIGGGSAAIGDPLIALAVWLVGALLVTLAVAARPGGPEATAGVGASARPTTGATTGAATA